MTNGYNDMFYMSDYFLFHFSLISSIKCELIPFLIKKQFQQRSQSTNSLYMNGDLEKGMYIECCHGIIYLIVNTKLLYDVLFILLYDGRYRSDKASQ